MQSSSLENATGATFGPIVLGRPVPLWWIAAGLFLFALLLRLSCFTGLIASDDLTYSRFAQAIADGRYVLESHYYAIRFGVILPVGLSYALFGVNEWSTIAVPLVASSLAVVIIALCGTRLFGVRAGLIAALLLATFPVQLYHATILVPESIAECYAMLAMLAYVWKRDKPTMALGALAGALVGVAYLTKEPTLFIAPALLLDAALRRQWRLVAAVALGLGTVIAAEHVYYLTMSGDLLFRPHAMSLHNNYVTGGRGQLDDTRVGLDFRLFHEYPRMMLLPNIEFGVHSLIALALSVIALIRFRKDQRAYLLVLWAAVPWLYLNFGTSSFSHYIPIPVSARYISIVYPPLFLLSGWLLVDFMSKTVWAPRLATTVLVAVIAVGVVCGLSTRGKGYRTNHVAVMRVIADRVVRKGIDSVCFDIEPDTGVKARWPRAFFILTGGRVPVCEGNSGRMTIRTDAFGYPYVAAITP